MGYDTEEIIPNIELFNSLCTKLEKILEKICDPNLRSLENVNIASRQCVVSRHQMI